MWTTNRLTGSETERWCWEVSTHLSTHTSPVTPDTAAVQLPPVYEQVLPPATTSTSIPLEDNVAYVCKLRHNSVVFTYLIVHYVACGILRRWTIRKFILIKSNVTA